MTTTTGTSQGLIGLIAPRRTLAATFVDANVHALKWGRSSTGVSVHALCHLLLGANAGVSHTLASSRSTAKAVAR